MYVLGVFTVRDVTRDLIHWAGAKQRYAGDYVFEASRAKLSEEVSHAATFKLKDTQRVPFSQHRVSGCIVIP
ncbi:MAG: hypothetical protein DDT38_01267 [Firmicutes bacterium]|nr:hypothetical protein [candidate division NPL-UPA2 bacterium]